MLELTDEQRAAIDCRKHSVALSAGAGCGKTFVLTYRFISHLEADNNRTAKQEPTRLSQLIAITFTDAAAREMRSRIRAACYEKLMSADSAESQQHWLNYLREIDAARISTIHAFCASLLRAHAARAGLDPAFGVLDQADANVLQYQVIDDVLRERLAALDENALDLAAAFGLATLKQQIADMLVHRHEPAFRQWQAAAASDLVAAWHDWHDKFAVPNAVPEIAAAAPIDTLSRQLADLAVPPGRDKLREARASLLGLLPRLKSADPTLCDADLDLVRESAIVKGVCSAKDWPAGEYETYLNACKALRDAIDKFRPHPFDDAAAEEAARRGIELLRLTAVVADAYENQKSTQGKLDFDDLLAKTYALLTKPENADITERLAGDLQLLLVDEFQDTDQLQVDLVVCLCGNVLDSGRLFLVGDFKQSIYRFRGAEPAVFIKLREQVSPDGQKRLVHNYRSQPGVLHFVNALFCDTLARIGESYESLQPKREQITRKDCVEFLWTITPDKNDRSKRGNAREARVKEALAIARRLRTLIDPASDERPVVDKKTGRPRQLKLGDVAILFRTLNDIQVYEEALREYDLDYYLVGGFAFYAQQEIFDVLNLLRAVASTADDLSLAGALRSPFFALSDETLFWLADSAGSLNAGLFADPLPKQLSNEERVKTAAAAETIAHLRSMKNRVPIVALLNAALDRTGYDAVLVAEYLGERKLANLHKLLEQARAADQSGAIDFDGFITQLAQFIAREPKESVAATLPEAANVIRLMTIHHAKGLEFPLVIVPDLDRPPLLRSPVAALHPVLGPLVAQPPDDDAERVSTGMTLFSALERREDLEERKRMLYVACTRAADYLILSSSIEAFDHTKSDWMALIGERFNLQSGALIAKLPDGYEAPVIHIAKDANSEIKPSRRERGPDLWNRLAEAHQLAAHGQGSLPGGVAPIPIDRTAQNQFSFSRLTGRLIRVSDSSLASTYDVPPGASAADDRPTQNDSASAMRVRKTGFDTTRSEARSLGTLVHDVLSRIDFANPTDIAEWCEHLAPLHVLSMTDQACRSAREMIEQFVAGPRGRQLAEAKVIHREVEFLLPWPLDKSSTDGRYIQGVIDCIYQDAAGNWHILDFKTNDIKKSEITREAQQYELQLLVYALAVERSLGKPPMELALCFLRPAQEFLVPWTTQSRNSAIAQLNQSIESALTPALTPDP